MRWFARALCVLIVIFPAAAICAAPATVSTGKVPPSLLSDQMPFAVRAADWNQVLQWVQRRLNENDELSPAQTQELLAKIRGVRSPAERARDDEAGGQMTTTQTVLEALGPPPGETDPPEPRDITDRRKSLRETLALHRAHVVQAELAVTMARTLEEAISVRRREQVLEQLQRRDPQPWEPEVLLLAASQAHEIAARMMEAPVLWYAGTTEEQRESLQIVRLLLALAGGGAGGALCARLLLRRFGCDDAEGHPSYSRRLGAAIVEGVARGLMPAALLAAGFLWVHTHIEGMFEGTLKGLIGMVFFLVVVTGLSRAVLAPNQPAWRLTDLPPRKARTLHLRLVLLSSISALDMFFHFGTGTLDIGAEVQSVYRLLFLGMEATAIVFLTQRSLWLVEETESSSSRLLHRVLRRGISGAVVLAVAATIIGFAELGRYVIHNLIISGVGTGGLWLLRGLMQETLVMASGHELLANRLGLDPKSLKAIGFWGRAAIMPLLTTAGVMLIAPSWGVPRDDLIRWAGLAVTGIPLGNVTLSLVDLVTAMAVFLVVLGVTRRVQRRLSEHILPATRLDAGVQHSLGAIIGYVGIVIAAAVAVAVAGINLGNLALVAGALSVGIGFGLQNIVNNFVSGLILLVERPIRVGDWVVVGQSEGIVRRINIRATELETWERASVVIPNADILSGKLMNWTLKDKLGRIDIRVGVAYESDLEKVRQVLLAVAREHPQVLEQPPPFVLFQHFGDSSLEFELRAYTGDVFGRGRCASDMRFIIMRRFQEEGIEVPYPQRTLHMARPSSPPSPMAGSEASGEAPEEP